jgi:hypothetical protein
MAALGQLPEPQIGALLKVWLPGESPWAECVAINPDGTWEGTIDNELFAEMPEAKRQQVWPGGTLPRLHNFRRGQTVKFKRETSADCELWVPAEVPGSRA